MEPLRHSSDDLFEKMAADSCTHSQFGAILLLGPPGVGKGTQARQLSRIWGIPRISTGDLLRTNIARATRLGRAVKDIVDRGDLITDSLVQEMLEIRVSEADTANGYILDGFPRTLEQAIWLTGDGSTIGKQHSFLAISIQVPRSQLVQRITGRMYCPVCQTTYNLSLNAPKVEGLCDLHDAQLIRRCDDTEDTLKKRLDNYFRLTLPVITYFRAYGQLVEVSGDGPIEWITERILGAHHLVSLEAHIDEARQSGLKASIFEDK